MDLSNISATKGENGFPIKAKLPKVDSIGEFVRKYGGPATKFPQNNPRQTEDCNAFGKPTVIDAMPKQSDKPMPLCSIPSSAANIVPDPAQNIYGPQKMSKDTNVKRDLFTGPMNQYFDKKIPASQKPVKLGRSVKEIKSQSSPLLRMNECQEIVRQKPLRSTQDKSVVSRKDVEEVVDLFHEVVTKVSQESKADSKNGKWVLLKSAAMILADQHKWINTGKILGPLPGVEVGDRFQCRAELVVIGLHQQFYDGIDYMKKDGKILATSIVDSGRYVNNKKSTDVLIYSGHGGNPAVVGKKRPRSDQKLRGGNLSLKNSKESRTPVRVIRGYNSLDIDNYVGTTDQRISNITYIYDGLYLVDTYWQERSDSKLVFKFSLKRIPGQPELSLQMVNGRTKHETHETPLENDLSLGKEKMAVRAADVTGDWKPASFNYITDMVYPDLNNHSFPSGCNCIDGCNNSKKCLCAIKNGGKIMYTNNGCILEAKQFIYECGPLCKCSSCINRVSQQGIRFQLEIFKSEPNKWGVRSLFHIPSGSFICEYIGEVFRHNEVQPVAGYNKYMFNIGKSASSSCDENYGFTIDATHFGNVGRFMNRSSSPNVYAQNVLYDHDDKRMPHIMFFALKDIPPLKELTYNNAMNRSWK